MEDAIMSEGMVNAVVFDLYGTLVDIATDEQSPEFWEQFSRDLRRQGIDAEATSLRLLYTRLCEEAVERVGGEGFILEGVFERLLGALVRKPTEYGVTQLAERFRSLSIKSLTIRPYSKPLLATLIQSRCKTALASNTEAIFTRFDLRQCGLDSYFDAIVLSSDVGMRKPDPRLFHLVLSRLEVSEDRAVFIGDTFEDDILGAQQAGLRSLFVNPRGATFGSRQLLASPRVIGVLPSLASIEQGLQDLGWRQPNHSEVVAVSNRE
jgi:putative hydrolase of the HAD superfamily